MASANLRPTTKRQWTDTKVYDCPPDHNREYSIPRLPVIGNNVYMAKGCIIFEGTTMGNNVTLGANAVVNKSIAANTGCEGGPAK